jgi:Heparinase II/III-like protein/Heparinase II/III N-terminus
MTSQLVDPAAERRITPRSIFCVNEHAYRDRRVAEDVCAGRFTHCGITLELGPQPDWLGAELPADEEWAIDWFKFYYGRDLASAFRDTGERRFLAAWERLVASWIRQVPVGTDATDDTARRIQNWVYAWAGFASTPAFQRLADGLDGLILSSIAEQADYICNNLTTERNHRTLELYALFTVALALPHLDLDGELVEFTSRELHRNLLEETRADGVHFEQSTHYHCVVLRSLLGLRENTRRFGLRLPGDFDTQLERACEFAMHCHRPDGEIPAISDADSGSYPELLHLAGELLDRPDFVYAATAGASGRPPAERHASFPAGGYFFQRSGWGERATPFTDERFLVFDCGPLGAGGHGHYDLLSVELAAGGRPLLVDPGRYTYSEHEPDPAGVARNMRHWFKGTAGHNTVCVDGLDQTSYHRGKHSGPAAEPHFLGRFSVTGLDVLEGEALSPCYEAVHRRRVWFVADEYWVIEDMLSGEQPHRYELRFHLAPEASGRVRLERQGSNAVVRAPGMALVLAAPHEPRIERGFFAPLYGIKHDAPVVSAVADGSPRASFCTVVAPLAADARAPAIEVRGDGRDAPLMIEVDGVGPGGSARDELRFGEPGPRPAHASWRRLDAEGQVLVTQSCERDEW